MSDNPALVNVNTLDAEDCYACAEAESWPCSYHQGVLDADTESRRALDERDTTIEKLVAALRAVTEDVELRESRPILCALLDETLAPADTGRNEP